MTIDKQTATVGVGNTTTVVATVAPENATNKNVTWTSSDEMKATVSGGVVTGVAAGEAVVKAITEDGSFEASSTITVTE